VCLLLILSNKLDLNQETRFTILCLASLHLSEGRQDLNIFLKTFRTDNPFYNVVVLKMFAKHLKFGQFSLKLSVLSLAPLHLSEDRSNRQNINIYFFIFQNGSSLLQRHCSFQSKRIGHFR
jgi:hypothetical protein